MNVQPINTKKVHRLVNVCPNCNSVVFQYKDNNYNCNNCKCIFDIPDLSPNTNILDFNYYINILVCTNGFIYIDGLSFGFLDKLNTILEKNNSYVNIDMDSFRVKLSMFKHTRSEFSKIQLLKIREDYLDHEKVFDKLLVQLKENKEGPLSSETFDINIKTPVYLSVSDFYDLEQLTYDLSKTEKDGEVDALLEMFSTINASMYKK